jgi:phage terminase small subunit
VKKLNAHERRFVGEYLIDCDPKRAAVAAGYSKTVAATKAYQWVSNGKGKPHVFAAVQKALEKHAQKLEMTADRVLSELALMGFANMKDYIKTTKQGDAFVDLSQLTRAQAAAIQEITVDEYMDGHGPEARQVKKTKFKLADKRGSLELLARHLRLLPTRVELSGQDDGPMVIEIRDLRGK